MTEIHITADKEVWTGASTIALLCAQQATNGVVISAGDEDIIQRFRRNGLEPVRCPMSGLLASLHLSRALRHIAGDAFEVYIHSSEIIKSVESAVKLVGRKEPIKLKNRKMPVFPQHEVIRGDNLIMWLGNITDDCGLKELIEDFAKLTESKWRLRVVGQGKATIVTPILKRAKALDIFDRIEWIGYSENPYEHMNGVAAAIVKDKDSIAAREFSAASIPTYTQLSDFL